MRHEWDKNETNETSISQKPKGPEKGLKGQPPPEEKGLTCPAD